MEVKDQLHATAALSPGKASLVTTEYEARLAPGPIPTLQRKKNIILLVKVIELWSLGSSCRTVVTVPTELSSVVPPI